MGGLRSLANPARPLCLGGIFRPLRGTECCPIFGQLGERECCPFFCSIPSREIPGFEPGDPRDALRAPRAAPRRCSGRGVGDGVAEARAAQELGGREGLPVVQHDPLARLPHRDEAPLGHLPARPHEPAARAWGTAPGPPAPASRSGTCSASSTLKYCRKRKILSSLRRFSVSSCTQPPARSCSSWDSFSVRSTGAPPKASWTAGSCRKSPSSRNRTRRFVESSAMSAHSPTSSCVTSSTTSQSSEQRPARMVLRTQWSAVCAPSPRFWMLQCVLEIRVTPSPSCERLDLPRKVRLARARHAGQQEAVAVEAVLHGILHVAPGLLLRRRLRLQPRLLVLSLQALHLLEAILGRVVPVAPPGQRLHHMHELSRKALIDQAVGLQRHQVAGGTSRRAGGSSPSPRTPKPSRNRGRAAWSGWRRAPWRRRGRSGTGPGRRRRPAGTGSPGRPPRDWTFACCRRRPWTGPRLRSER